MHLLHTLFQYDGISKDMAWQDIGNTYTYGGNGGFDVCRGCGTKPYTISEI